LIEARLEGRQSIAVIDNAGTHEHSVAEGIEKLKNSMDTILG